MNDLAAVQTALTMSSCDVAGFLDLRHDSSIANGELSEKLELFLVVL